jgi:hypothetical protein
MYFPVLLWSLVIFASFWGYGEALRRALKRPEFDDLGWGLTAAWGMAVTLAIGGFLMMLSLAKAPVLTGVVLLGAALAAGFAAQNLSSPASKKSNKQISESRWNFHPAYVFIWLLAGLAFASAVVWPHQIDPNDDLVCYLMLPEKILATGTLIEPFSFQRAGTFGGQALLQALVMIVGNETTGHVPDRGLAMLMIFGMLMSALRSVPPDSRWFGFFLLLAFWFVPVPRISTNGAMTGGCLLVALVATFSRVKTLLLSKNLAAFVPAGLVAAAACSIRPTFALVAVTTFAGLVVWRIFENRGARLPQTIAPFVFSGLLCTAVLVPFMVVLYQSNGAPIIPPFSGFVSEAYQTFDFPETSKNLASLFNFLTGGPTVVLLVLLSIAAILPGGDGRGWVLGGMLAACSLIVFRFAAIAYYDQYRYIYPIMLPVVLWYLATGLSKIGLLSPAEAKIPRRAVTAGLILFTFVNLQGGVQELNSQVQSLALAGQPDRSFLPAQLKSAYKGIQQKVPPGEKVLTMVDAGYWLDYARNPMQSINAVGGASPPPGIPFGKGPDALRDYLRALGFKYILAVDFNNAVLLYTRRLWTEATRPEWIYPQLWRPRFLDVMDSIDAFDKQGKVIAREGNLRLIQLDKS